MTLLPVIPLPQDACNAQSCVRVFEPAPIPPKITEYALANTNGNCQNQISLIPVDLFPVTKQRWTIDLKH